MAEDYFFLSPTQVIEPDKIRFFINGNPVKVLVNSLSIDDAIGERSTCSFVVISDTTTHFQQGQPVEIYDEAGDFIFAGVIDKPEEKRIPGKNILLHTIRCKDWHYLADKRLIAKAYENMFAGDIVSDIITNKLAAEGITGGHQSRTETTPEDFAKGSLVDVVATVGGSLELPKTMDDDFNDNSIDTAKWISNTGGAGTVAEVDSVLSYTGKTAATSGPLSQVRTKQALAGDFDLSIRQRRTTEVQGNVGLFIGSYDDATPTNATGYLLCMTPAAWAIYLHEPTPADYTNKLANNGSHAPNVWYTLRVKRTGTQWQFFINGALALTEPNGPTLDVYLSTYRYWKENGNAGDNGGLEWDDFTVNRYKTSGSRTSPAVDLPPTARLSAISWTATIPANTVLTIETSLDDGNTWQAATSGGEISGISAGDDLTGKSLLVRQSLATSDASVSPQLNSIAVNIRSASIQDGVNVVEAVFNYVPTTRALDALAEKTGFLWWIDFDKKLYFVERATFAAPWTVTGADILKDVTVEHGNPQYRNTQYIKGGTDITDPQTEEFHGDGKRTAFTTGYKIAKVPTITLNGAAQSTGIRGVDDGKQWYWSKGENAVSQDNSGTPISSTDTLSVTYQGEFSIVVLSKDFNEISTRQGIEQNSGMNEDVADEPETGSREAAFQSASAKLEKYSVIGRRVKFRTLRRGLEAGQVATVNLPEHGINNEEMLIESVTISDDGMKLFYDVSAAEGPEQGSWTKMFEKMATRGQAFVVRENISENEVLISLEQFPESVTWSESVTQAVYACPVPSVNLFPSSTLYPC